MINLFGISVEAPQIKEGQYLETLLNDISKRDNERQILRDFIRPRIEEIIDRSQNVPQENSNLTDFLPQARNFFLEQLKKSGQYEQLVLEVINSPIAHQILVGKSPILPPTFPGEHKKAESLVTGSISSAVDIPQVKEFLIRKHFRESIQQTARIMFYGINHDLSPERCLQFLSIIYELDKIKTAEPVGNLQQVILESLKNGTPLELVHIKSIRFTYPDGKNLQVIEDTDQVIQSRIYPSEEAIFQRLLSLVKTFENNGLKVNSTLIVSDHDLDYCFPSNQKIVPEADVTNARKSIDKYINFLKYKHPELSNIYTLTDFLRVKGIDEKYENLFNVLRFQGDGGGGQHVSEKILEMRVNGQYEHYSEMFPNYSRNLARYTAIRQIANVLALSVIFESFPTTPLLVIDSRGFEDQLIGGYNPKSVAKYFTKLKDPVIKC